MLHSGYVSSTKKYEIFPRYIQLPNAVEHDVTVNVTCAVMPIFLGTDEYLMTGKSFSSQLHAKLLSTLRRKTILVVDGFVGEFVMLHREIFGCNPIIRILYLDVFNSRHGIPLSALSTFYASL